MWLDTAGLRDTRDPIEAEAVRRSQQLIAGADAVLLVLDVSDPSVRAGAVPDGYRLERPPSALVLNKSDLLASAPDAPTRSPSEWGAAAVVVSAQCRTGLDALRRRLLAGAGRAAESLAAPAAFTERQAQAIAEAASGPQAGLRERLLACVGGPAEA
jgi:tRNA modification GTPase